MELEIQIIAGPLPGRSQGAGAGIRGQAAVTSAARRTATGRCPTRNAMSRASHCEIEFHDDAFWVRDTSRNGVFVNDATERVGYGHRVRLDDGDRLRLGLYELIVRLRDHGRLVGHGHPEPVDSRSRGDDHFARTVNLPAAAIDHHPSPQDAPELPSTGDSGVAIARGAGPRDAGCRSRLARAAEISYWITSTRQVRSRCDFGRSGSCHLNPRSG